MALEAVHVLVGHRAVRAQKVTAVLQGKDSTLDDSTTGKREREKRTEQKLVACSELLHPVHVGFTIGMPPMLPADMGRPERTLFAHCPNY